MTEALGTNTPDHHSPGSDSSCPQTSGATPASRDPRSIQAMFDSIAKRYDLANTVLSFGIHHWWRRSLVKASGVTAGASVLDAATGTGDLAFAFARTLGATGRVIGGDFSEQMLECAREKQQGRWPWLSFQSADVMSLPFADCSFDAVSISFGIRNVADPERGLSELARVLKPGGRLMVLEFGTGSNNLWGTLFRWYSTKVLPVIGGLVTGKPDAYRYLEKSSAGFPSRDEFAALIKRSANWTSVNWRSLSGGIAFLYTAQK